MDSRLVVRISIVFSLLFVASLKDSNKCHAFHQMPDYDEHNGPEHNFRRPNFPHLAEVDEHNQIDHSWMTMPKGGRFDFDVGSDGAPRLDNRVRIDEFNKPSAKCDKKIKVSNGVTRIRDKGTIVRFQCSYGFQMLGASVAVCMKGQWSEPPPSCVRAGCRAMAIPLQGRMRQLYGGGLIAFTCNYGFLLSGDRVLTCDGQKWNGTAPTCLEMPPITLTPKPSIPRIPPPAVETTIPVPAAETTIMPSPAPVTTIMPSPEPETTIPPTIPSSPTVTTLPPRAPETTMSSPSPKTTILPRAPETTTQPATPKTTPSAAPLTQTPRPITTIPPSETTIAPPEPEITPPETTTPPPETTIPPPSPKTTIPPSTPETTPSAAPLTQTPRPITTIPPSETTIAPPEPEITMPSPLPTTYSTPQAQPEPRTLVLENPDSDRYDFSHLLAVIGITLVSAGVVTIVGGILTYYWRKRKGIARPNRYDLDGRTLRSNDGNEEFMWSDSRESGL